VDAVQESANENVDRVWRRWEYFCETEIGILNPRLDDFSPDETELILRAFFSRYRRAKFKPNGTFCGWRDRPLASTTIRGAAGALAAAFRNRFRRSPLHFQDTKNYLPSLRRLFQAFDKLSPPPKRQRAVTPKLLRQLQHLRSDLNNETNQAIDIIVGAFFFAMRACEYVKTPVKGHTKIARLRCLEFRDRKRKIVPHSHPRLTRHSKFVTITFEDQKNKLKFDKRTQQRTNNPFLCPVKRWGSAVKRILSTIPTANGNTPICSFNDLGRHKVVTSSFTRNLLRSTCEKFGGKPKFGFAPSEIGNKSVRSGAAMSLFLNNHSPAKIMILGRWSSDAFLVYIRPQVLEWTNNMSSDMINFDDFLDMTFYDRTSPRNSKLPKYRPKNGLSSKLKLPKFNIDF